MRIDDIVGSEIALQCYEHSRMMKQELCQAIEMACMHKDSQASALRLCNDAAQAHLTTGLDIAKVKAIVKEDVDPLEQFRSCWLDKPQFDLLLTKLNAAEDQTTLEKGRIVATTKDILGTSANARASILVALLDKYSKLTHVSPDGLSNGATPKPLKSWGLDRLMSTEVHRWA